MGESTDVRETDLVVIGAGPGGYTAAFAAADRGVKGVVLVDADEQPGGVCLNRGCIPSKALLHVARLITETHEAQSWGVRFARPEIDITALRRWKSDVVNRNANGIRQLAKANIRIDRKLLADMALQEPQAFAKLVEQVKNA